MSSLMALLLLACAEEPAAPAPPAAPPAPRTYAYEARAAELNVIFISMDALRFDRTGAGGSNLTPKVDAFGKEAVLFTHATSAAPWTVPSHMAMWTGRWPTHHKVVNKLKPGPEGDLIFDALAADIPTYPETLVKSGWKGAAFTGGAGVQAKFGYGRGFETYLDDTPFAGMDYSGPPAAAWVKAHGTDHFFLFFHGYDAHGQHGLVDQTPRQAVPDYGGTLDGGIVEQAALREKGLAAIVKPGDPPHLDGLSAEDTRFLTAGYDAKVKEADARVGKFLETLKESGVYDRSIIVLLGDHGEEFMEHGYLDHGATLCQHQLHVPMMIRFPGGTGARVVDDPVRTIDVYPTVFDALGLPPIPAVDGKSLLPLLRGEKVDLPIFAESDYRLFVHLRGVHKGNNTFILDLEDGQKSLYDLAADPDERNDLSATDARTTYELEQSVRGWLGELGTNPDQYLGVEEAHIKLF